MPIRSLLLSGAYPLLPFLNQETESGSGGGGENPLAGQSKDDDVKFDDKQQAKVNALIAEAKRKAEAQTKSDIEAQIAEEKAKAEAERDREKQESEGKYKEAKESLTKERDDARAELETVKADYELMKEHMEKQYKAALDELPKDYLAFQPEDDAPFTSKLAWLDKAREQAKERDPQRPPRGNGDNPVPGQPNHEEQPQLDARTAF